MRYCNSRSFTYHVMEMCMKASSQAWALASLSSILDTKSKFMIFNAFVVSNLLYCPLVWHMCCVSDYNKMEKVQERALRYVLNDFNNTYSIYILHMYYMCNTWCHDVHMLYTSNTTSYHMCNRCGTTYWPCRHGVQIRHIHIHCVYFSYQIKNKIQTCFTFNK